MPTKEEAAKLTVPELKAALKALGLPVTGKKDDLVDRLSGSTGAASEPATNVTADAPVVSAAPDHVPATASDPSKHAKIVFAGSAVPDDATMTSVQATNKLEVIKPAAAEPAAAAAAKPLTEAERIKLRAERFKDPEVEKAKSRALRFGIVHPEVESEKAIKRAERFGLSHPALEEQKRRERAERFGIVPEEVKLDARKERFKPLSGGKTTAAAATVGSAEFEAKKKARAERFGPL